MKRALPNRSRGLLLTRTQTFAPPIFLLVMRASSGASGKSQPEEAPVYTSQARGKGLSRANRRTGQALNALQDIMRSGNEASYTKSSSATATTGISAGTSTTSNESLRSLHVSRNSAFDPATAMKHLGSASVRSKSNLTAENMNNNTDAALPPL